MSNYLRGKAVPQEGDTMIRAADYVAQQQQAQQPVQQAPAVTPRPKVDWLKTRSSAFEEHRQAQAAQEDRDAAQAALQMRQEAINRQEAQAAHAEAAKAAEDAHKTRVAAYNADFQRLAASTGRKTIEDPTTGQLTFLDSDEEYQARRAKEREERVKAGVEAKAKEREAKLAEEKKAKMRPIGMALYESKKTMDDLTLKAKADPEHEAGLEEATLERIAKTKRQEAISGAEGKLDEILTARVPKKGWLGDENKDDRQALRDKMLEGDLDSETEAELQKVNPDAWKAASEAAKDLEQWRNASKKYREAEDAEAQLKYGGDSLPADLARNIQQRDSDVYANRRAAIDESVAKTQAAFKAKMDYMDRALEERLAQVQDDPEKAAEVRANMARSQLQMRVAYEGEMQKLDALDEALQVEVTDFQQQMEQAKSAATTLTPGGTPAPEDRLGEAKPPAGASVDNTTLAAADRSDRAAFQASPERQAIKQRIDAIEAEMRDTATTTERQKALGDEQRALQDQYWQDDPGEEIKAAITKFHEESAPKAQAIFEQSRQAMASGMSPEEATVKERELLAQIDTSGLNQKVNEVMNRQMQSIYEAEAKGGKPGYDQLQRVLAAAGINQDARQFYRKTLADHEAQVKAEDDAKLAHIAATHPVAKEAMDIMAKLTRKEDEIQNVFNPEAWNPMAGEDLIKQLGDLSYKITSDEESYAVLAAIGKFVPKTDVKDSALSEWFKGMGRQFRKLGADSKNLVTGSQLEWVTEQVDKPLYTWKKEPLTEANWWTIMSDLSTDPKGNRELTEDEKTKVMDFATREKRRQFFVQNLMNTWENKAAALEYTHDTAEGKAKGGRFIGGVSIIPDTIPYMVALTSPVSVAGGPLVIGSFGEDMRKRLEGTDLTANEKLMVAVPVGVVQKKIEELERMLAVGGKLPVVSPALAGLKKWVANSAVSTVNKHAATLLGRGANLLAQGAARTGVEMVEETLQQATPFVGQVVYQGVAEAANLNKLPAEMVDLVKFWETDMEPFFEMWPEMVIGMGLMTSISSIGSANAQHRQYVLDQMRNKTMMRAIGVPEADITGLMQQSITDPAAALKAFKGVKRDPYSPEAEAARQEINQARKIALQEIADPGRREFFTGQVLDHGAEAAKAMEGFRQTWAGDAATVAANLNRQAKEADPTAPDVVTPEDLQLAFNYAGTPDVALPTQKANENLNNASVTEALDDEATRQARQALVAQNYRDLGPQLAQHYQSVIPIAKELQQREADAQNAVRAATDAEAQGQKGLKEPAVQKYNAVRQMAASVKIAIGVPFQKLSTVKDDPEAAKNKDIKGEQELLREVPFDGAPAGYMAPSGEWIVSEPMRQAIQADVPAAMPFLQMSETDAREFFQAREEKRTGRDILRRRAEAMRQQVEAEAQQATADAQAQHDMAVAATQKTTEPGLAEEAPTTPTVKANPKKAESYAKKVAGNRKKLRTQLDAYVKENNLTGKSETEAQVQGGEFIHALAPFMDLFPGGIVFVKNGKMPQFRSGPGVLEVDPAMIITRSLARQYAISVEEIVHAATVEAARDIWGNNWERKFIELWDQLPQQLQLEVATTYGNAEFTPESLAALTPGERMARFAELIRMVIQQKDFGMKLTEQYGVPLTVVEAVWRIVERLGKTLQSWITGERAAEIPPAMKAEMDALLKQMRSSSKILKKALERHGFASSEDVPAVSARVDLREAKPTPAGGSAAPMSAGERTAQAAEAKRLLEDMRGWVAEEMKDATPEEQKRASAIAANLATYLETFWERIAMGSGLVGWRFASAAERAANRARFPFSIDRRHKKLVINLEALVRHPSGSNPMFIRSQIDEQVQTVARLLVTKITDPNLAVKALNKATADDLPALMHDINLSREGWNMVARGIDPEAAKAKNLAELKEKLLVTLRRNKSGPTLGAGDAQSAEEQEELAIAATPEPNRAETMTRQLSDLNHLMTTPNVDQADALLQEIRGHSAGHVKELARRFVVREARDGFRFMTKMDALRAIRTKLAGHQRKNRRAVREQFEVILGAMNRAFTVGEGLTVPSLPEAPTEPVERTGAWLRPVTMEDLRRWARPNGRDGYDGFDRFWRIMNKPEHRQRRELIENVLGLNPARNHGLKAVHTQLVYVHDMLMAGLDVPFGIRKLAYENGWKLDADGYPLRPHVLADDDPLMQGPETKPGWEDVREKGARAMVDAFPVAPAGTQPRVTIIAGSAKSGRRKLAARLHQMNVLPTDKGIGRLEATEHIPEFDQIAGSGDGRAVEVTQNAVEDMLGRAMQMAAQERRNVTVFSSFADPDAMMGGIEAFKAAGYAVDVIGATRESRPLVQAVTNDYKQGYWLALPEVFQEIRDNHMGMLVTEVQDAADTFTIFDSDSNRQLAVNGDNFASHEHALEFAGQIYGRARSKPSGRLFGPLANRRSPATRVLRRYAANERGREGQRQLGSPSAPATGGSLAQTGVGASGYGGFGRLHHDSGRGTAVAALEDALHEAAVDALEKGALSREEVIRRYTRALVRLRRWIYRRGERAQAPQQGGPTLNRHSAYSAYGNTVREQRAMGEAMAVVFREALENPAMLARRLASLEADQRAATNGPIAPNRPAMEVEQALDRADRLQRAGRLEDAAAIILTDESAQATEPSQMLNREAVYQGYEVGRRLLQRRGLDQRKLLESILSLGTPTDPVPAPPEDRIEVDTEETLNPPEPPVFPPEDILEPPGDRLPGPPVEPEPVENLNKFNHILRVHQQLVNAVFKVQDDAWAYAEQQYLRGKQEEEQAAALREQGKGRDAQMAERRAQQIYDDGWRVLTGSLARAEKMMGEVHRWVNSTYQFYRRNPTKREQLLAMSRGEWLELTPYVPGVAVEDAFRGFTYEFLAEIPNPSDGGATFSAGPGGDLSAARQEALNRFLETKVDLPYEESDVERTPESGDPASVARELAELTGQSDGNTGQSALAAWARSNNRVLQGERFVATVRASGRSAQGAEHVVYFFGDRVVKVTQANRFTTISPVTYLEELANSNEAFWGGSIRVEGIVDIGAGPQIVTSMPFIKGRAATEKEKAAYFRTLGYYATSPGAAPAYYNPDTKMEVRDARDVNVLVGTDGIVWPVDVHVQRVPEFLEESFANSVRSTLRQEAFDSAPENLGPIERIKRFFKRVSEDDGPTFGAGPGGNLDADIKPEMTPREKVKLMLPTLDSLAEKLGRDPKEIRQLGINVAKNWKPEHGPISEALADEVMWDEEQRVLASAVDSTGERGQNASIEPGQPGAGKDIAGAQPDQQAAREFKRRKEFQQKLIAREFPEINAKLQEYRRANKFNVYTLEEARAAGFGVDWGEADEAPSMVDSDYAAKIVAALRHEAANSIAKPFRIELSEDELYDLSDKIEDGIMIGQDMVTDEALALARQAHQDLMPDWALSHDGMQWRWHHKSKPAESRRRPPRVEWRHVVVGRDGAGTGMDIPFVRTAEGMLTQVAGLSDTPGKRWGDDPPPPDYFDGFYSKDSLFVLQEFNDTRSPFALFQGINDYRLQLEREIAPPVSVYRDGTPSTSESTTPGSSGDTSLGASPPMRGDEEFAGGVSEEEQILAGIQDFMRQMEAMSAPGDVIHGMYDRQLDEGLTEEEGARTMGDPRYANPGTTADSRRAFDVTAVGMREGFTPETIEQWDEAGQTWIEQVGKQQAINEILKMGLAGETLTPAQTRAAMTLADDLWKEALASNNPLLIREARNFTWAYAAHRRANAQALAAGRDKMKSPAERNLEYVTRFLTKLSPQAEARVEAAPRASRQQVLEDEQAIQWARVETELALQGLTLNDVFNGEAAQRLREAPAVQRVIEAVGKNPAEREALRLMIQGESNRQISIKTRLGAKTTLVPLEARFRAAMMPIFEQWASLGLTITTIPQEGTTGTETALGAPGGASAVARSFMGTLLANQAARNAGRVRLAGPSGPRFNPADVGSVVLLARMIQAINGNWSDVWYELNISSLLSGLKTFKRNIVGTALNGILEYTVKHWMRYLVNKVARDPASAQTIEEYGYILRGFIPGLIDGIRHARMAWQNEFASWDSEKLNEPVMIETINERGGGRVAISQTPFLQFFGSEGFDWLTRNRLGRRIFGQGLWARYAEARRQAAQAALDAGASSMDAWAAGEQAGQAVIQNSWQQHAQEAADSIGFGTGPLSLGWWFRGSTIRIPLRAMMMVDQFQSALFGRMEVGAQAYRLGKARGLSGQALTDFMGEEVLNHGSESWVRAVAKSQELSFRTQLRSLEEGGTHLEALTRSINMGLSRRRANPVAQGAQLFLRTKVRFLTTIFNIFTSMLSMTPVALAYHTPGALLRIRRGQGFVPGDRTAQVNFWANQAIGGGLLALIWGMVEGDDDDDDKELLLTGTHAYGSEKKGEIELAERTEGSGLRLRVGGKGGKYVNLTHKDPMSGTLGTLIDMVRAAKLRESADLTNKEYMAMNLRMLRAQTSDKSFTQSIADLAELAEAFTSEDGDIAGAVGDYLLDTAEQFSPALLKSPIRDMEDNMISSWERPWWHGFIPAGGVGKVDIYGRDIQKELSDSNWRVMRLMFDVGIAPSGQTEERFDTFLQEYIRQGKEWPEGVSIPASKREYEYRSPDQRAAIKMTANEARAYNIAVGQRFARESRLRLAQSDLRNPREEKLTEIVRLLGRIRQEERRKMFPTHREWERMSSGDKARLPEDVSR